MNIDALIAEKLFGWKPNTPCDGEMNTRWDEGGWVCNKCLHEGDWGKDFEHSIVPLAYSTDSAHLVLILEALRKKGLLTGISFEKKECWVRVVKDDEAFEVVEDSLPLALCKAALLALGEKVE